MTADWPTCASTTAGGAGAATTRARELEAWARRMPSGAAREVFAYFNNDWEAFAPRNAQALAGGC